MAAVHERQGLIVEQGAAVHRNIEHQRHILHHVQPLPEPGLGDRTSAPAQGGEVEPVAAQQRQRKVFTLQQCGMVRPVERLRFLHQGV